MSTEPERPIYRLFGIGINAVSMADTLALVERAIGGGDRLLIGVVNAAKAVNMHRDRALRKAMDACDIVLADSIAVVWALRLLGRKLPERIPGIDLMHAMLRDGQTRGYRVYLLGATEEVSRIVEDRMAELYPGVVVAGRRNGFYKPDEERAIVSAIHDAKADILFVAMSPPKKEIFLAQWREELGVAVCHGVGGAFDVVAGKTKRAPAMWQRLGMEWLYRVVQEPRRMWRRYLVTNTLFGWMLLGEMTNRLFGRSCQ